MRAEGDQAIFRHRSVASFGIETQPLSPTAPLAPRRNDAGGGRAKPPAATPALIALKHLVALGAALYAQRRPIAAASISAHRAAGSGTPSRSVAASALVARSAARIRPPYAPRAVSQAKRRSRRGSSRAVETLRDGGGRNRCVRWPAASGNSPSPWLAVAAGARGSRVIRAPGGAAACCLRGVHEISGCR